MIATRLAARASGRIHYSWIVLIVMFTAMLAGVGVRAAPGVMILPLQHAFGWDVGTISGAVGVNIILLGLVGPFLTGLVQVMGLKRTMLMCMGFLIVGTGLSAFMTEPWQLFITWGVMVGIGAGAGAVGMAAAVANRWFVERNGLAMGLLSAANAAGQLIFLPVLAMMAERWGWQGVAVGVCLAIICIVPLVMLFMPEWPADVGLGPYGTERDLRPRGASGNPFTIAISTLRRASKSVDFWLLTCSFGICGLSTNGLINTHLISYCADHGIPEMSAASVLAGLGAFSLMGSAASGWLCDRYNPRVLLFWYYSLRGLSLVVIPFTQFDTLSLTIFSVFYGLDWVATGPATFALTNKVFGRKDAPVIVSWIFTGHQIGGAIAAFGGGAIRSFTGDYTLAFLSSGVACLLASMLVLRISRPSIGPVLMPAE